MAKDSLRLDKAVSHNFDVPRNYAQKLIRQGCVTVDGVCVTEPSQKVLLSSLISIDGDEDNSVAASDAFEKRVYMLNKPEGFVCADRDKNYPVVVNIFSDERSYSSLHCVGRLDIDTTGLILVTDDGDFNHLVTSPKSLVTKTYRVALKNDVTEHDVRRFWQGLKHPEEKHRYKSALLEIEDPRSALVTVTEGRFHEVKRLFECVDNEVLELERIAIGTLELDRELDLGEYKELSDDEIAKVFEVYKPYAQKLEDDK
ncbi:MAG: pseudouridine synthase [Succinivibrio sp.]